MSEMTLSKESEEKRLADLKIIAENWDTIPEYAKGKLDGTISALAAIYCQKGAKKKAG